jgi:hypothetical protein
MKKKISKLHIDQLRAFRKNLEFDFTYQSGERKGQLLDKICFIATEKTGLLSNWEQHIKKQFSGDEPILFI